MFELLGVNCADVIITASKRLDLYVYLYKMNNIFVWRLSMSDAGSTLNHHNNTGLTHLCGNSFNLRWFRMKLLTGTSSFIKKKFFE